MRSLFCTNEKYYTNYFINQELYNRIKETANLIRYHASNKVMEYNFNVVFNLNNIQYNNERIYLKKKYKQIYLLNEQITKKEKTLLNIKTLELYSKIITDMENILLEMYI